MMPMMPPAGAWSSCWLNCASSALVRLLMRLATWSRHAHGLQFLLYTLVVEHLQQLLAIEVVLLLHDLGGADHRRLGERNLGEGEQVQRCQDGSDTANACCCSHGNDLCVKPDYQPWEAKLGSASPTSPEYRPDRRFPPPRRRCPPRRHDDRAQATKRHSFYAIRIYSGSPRNRSMRDLGDIDAYPRRSLVHGVARAARTTEPPARRKLGFLSFHLVQICPTLSERANGTGVVWMLGTRLKAARIRADTRRSSWACWWGMDEFSASARMNQYERERHSPTCGLPNSWPWSSRSPWPTSIARGRAGRAHPQGVQPDTRGKS